MGQNFGSNFLRGFGGTFPRTFDASYRYGLQKQEDEAIKQKAAEYEKKQQGIFNQMMANVTFDPKTMSIRQLTQEEYLQGVGQLSPSYLTKLKFAEDYKDKIRKQSEPKKKEYQSFGGKLYSKDPISGELDIDNPVLTEEKKPEKVWIRDKKRGDKMDKLMGYENPEADPNDPRTEIVGGKKYTVTDHSTFDIYEKKPSDGKNKLSDSIKKSFLDYYTKQQVLFATTKAGIKKIKAQGLDEDFSDVNTLLEDHNKVYTEFVNNSMSETAINWYRKLYNITTENKTVGNPDPEDYYRYLEKSYLDGNLGTTPGKQDEWEDVDFEVLVEKFKSIYGFDPKEAYR